MTYAKVFLTGYVVVLIGALSLVYHWRVPGRTAWQRLAGGAVAAFAMLSGVSLAMLASRLFAEPRYQTLLAGLCPALVAATFPAVHICATKLWVRRAEAVGRLAVDAEEEQLVVRLGQRHEICAYGIAPDLDRGSLLPGAHVRVSFTQSRITGAIWDEEIVGLAAA